MTDDQPLNIGLTTFDSRVQATDFGRQLVEAGLVACAQTYGLVNTVFSWEGQTEEAEEYTLLVKFPQELSNP